MTYKLIKKVVSIIKTREKKGIYIYNKTKTEEEKKVTNKNVIYIIFIHM